MTELKELKTLLNPVEILFVADAMTGQDAVKSADEFHKQLGITGVILTKMDGDARGGAALSIRSVTGQPLKFVGVGEKSDAFEAFHPDRAASRILGMGDIVSFVEKAQEAFDGKQQEEMQRKLIENEFTLEDFRDQLKSLRKLGSLESILKMMPKTGMMKELQNMQPDEKELTRIVAIIDSMTPRERDNHMIINGSRRRRIARGSGTSVNEVNNLLKQYGQARKMMKSLSGNMGFLGKKTGEDGDGQARDCPDFRVCICRIIEDNRKMLMIRLARFGAKKKPFYRVVVIEKERARDSRNLEVVGQYNPLTTPAQVKLNHERIEYWTKNGAQLSETVGAAGEE